MRDYPRSAISRDRTYYNNRTRRRLTVLSPPGSPSCPWRLILRVVNWSSHLVATPCSKVSILTDMMLFCRLDDLRQHQSFVQDMTVQWYWEIPQMFDNSLRPCSHHTFGTGTVPERNRAPVFTPVPLRPVVPERADDLAM